MKIYWLYKDESYRGRLWDQGLLEDMFKDEINILTSDIPKTDEAIVVLPARYFVEETKWLNDQIKNVGKLKLILSSDEESLFPIDKINHPSYKLYLMTPRFDRKYPDGTVFIGEGYPPHMVLPDEPPTKSLDYFFSGQITHERRQMLAKAEEVIEEFRENNQLKGKFNSTPGFTQGLKPEDYYKEMMKAKAVPCPAGPATPDSFRLFEALECGAVPIADSKSPAGVINYWQQLYPDAPFPIFEDYGVLQGELMNVRDNYPVMNNDCLAWWIRYKHDLKEDLLGVSTEAITVIVPTSPVKSNPDTSIIEETIASIRTHLPKAKIIITFDGVRPEQEELTDNYNEYIRRVLWLANRKWGCVYPLIFKEHSHQALMAKEALKHVKSPLVLYVEHDAPITPDREIEWQGLVNNIFNGQANLIRLCHEELILPDYKHMMIGDVKEVNGIPMIKTVQWSQRPHLASTVFYKEFLDKYFGDQKTMIEDKMHGIVHNAYIQDGELAWNLWRMWIYHPNTDDIGIKRSFHLDARGDAPKFEETFDE